MLRTSKATLFAAALCVASPALIPTQALARTFERCDLDGRHCVRVTCDYDGDRCWRQSQYYRHRYYRHRGRWVCDADGDRCHYEYHGHRWDPHWDHD